MAGFYDFTNWCEMDGWTYIRTDRYTHLKRSVVASKKTNQYALADPCADPRAYIACIWPCSFSFFAANAIGRVRISIYLTKVLKIAGAWTLLPNAFIFGICVDDSNFHV